jgi:hypothetical protein
VQPAGDNVEDVIPHFRLTDQLWKQVEET